MPQVDIHGKTMHGLKKASGRTKCLYSPEYVQISYNTETGEVLTSFHYDLGKNSFTRYDDENIILVTKTDEDLTQKQIAEKINDVLYMQDCLTHPAG